MTKLLQSALLTILLLSLLSKSLAQNSVKNLTTGNNQLSNKLYYEVALQKPGENLIMSPISLHVILSLMQQGAEGETAKDLAKVLNLPNKTDTAQGYKKIMGDLNNVKNVTLSLANKVYIMDKIKINATFKQVAEKSFYAGFESIDFAQSTQAAKTINEWTANKTNQKIKDLISSRDLNGDTRLVLINAIYFNGKWLRQFNKTNTKQEKFYTSKKTSVNCSMMHTEDKLFYAVIPELNATALQLQYSNTNFSLIVILPNDVEGIANLEKAIKNYDLAKISDKMIKQVVIVSLPQFKIETSIDLYEPLKGLGLDIIFNKPNFSGFIDSKESLKVSKFFQKAFIDVNEEGTEAAAVTVGSITPTIVVPKTEFKANHPFLYALQVNIKEGSKSISNTTLFYGKFMKPSK